MPPTEINRRHIITPSGLHIRTNVRDQTPRGSRAGIAALGVGEIFLFGETVLGLSVIALALLAGRKLRSRSQIQKVKRG